MRSTSVGESDETVLNHWAKWVERAQRGDHGAFSELVRAWHGRVYACCRCYFASDPDADDATQETFVRAHQQIHRLGAAAQWGSWLRGIARHVCLDMLRRQRRVSTLSSEASGRLLDPRGRDPAQEALVRDERKRLMSCVDELPDDWREVVLLHYFNEMTYDEMAEWLGVARATVNERLRKGRERLRQRMSLQGARGQ